MTDILVAQTVLFIMSGAQTGADGVGLDWAISRGLTYDGWRPKSRRSEDGPKPQRMVHTWK